jgi:23S rRNA (uracil1939-C5)-methyltransferase
MTHPAPARFDELLTARVHALSPRALRPGECQTPEGTVCALCHASRLPYAAELEVKQAALERFAETALEGITPPEPLIPSPKGREYRTTTKRKVFRNRRGFALGLIDPDDGGKLRALEVQECVIEPPEHGRIYGLVREYLQSPAGAPLSAQLRHVVLRGGGSEQTLVLTAGELSGTVLRSANRLSKMLSARVSSIAGAFLYEDTSRGSHYLGAGRAGVRPTFRKLFGKPEQFLRVRGRPFLFPPFVFSQVNPFLLERMVLTVAELLELDPRGTLFDLYCGYGLFGLSLADRVRDVVGVEVSALSVAAARRNAERQRVGNARFLAGDLTGERVGSFLRLLRTSDRLLLDPPRNGAAAGVIEAAAARRPHRVVHIACNIDLLPAELRRWNETGYRVTRAVPLDMFPGTGTIETVVALQPA